MKSTKTKVKIIRTLNIQKMDWLHVGDYTFRQLRAHVIFM